MRVLILLLCLMPLFSFAGEAQDLAKDPVLEKRMVGLAENLRCLVCQKRITGQLACRTGGGSAP